MSSHIGKKIRVSIFGESHGQAIGCLIEGLPAGIIPDHTLIRKRLDERKPGNSSLVTRRVETDDYQFLSGYYEDKLTGAPLVAVFNNNDQKSHDYDQIKSVYRPGHADYTAHIRYIGHNDYRGGGHFSGRLTAPLVLAGALAEQLLLERGVEILSHLVSVGSKSILDGATKEMLENEIIKVRNANDSVGGVVETIVNGMPAGIGTPIFETLEGLLAQALFSIPAVKGVSFGAGFDLSKMRGSEANDAFYKDEDGQIKTKSNHSGGINGGISNGMPIRHLCAFKPTSSIGVKQETLNFTTDKLVSFSSEGRHDPCIAVRGVPVVRAVTALILLDVWMYQNDGRPLK